MKYSSRKRRRANKGKDHFPGRDHFFSRVYDVVRKIPYGKVTSYGAIAEFLESKGSARIVGWAMNASHHLRQRIAAHRVVNRNGLLTGSAHFSTPAEMEDLLKSEGIPVKDGQIINFEKYFWDLGKFLRKRCSFSG